MILREVSFVVPLVYFTSKIETLLVSLIEIGSPTIHPFVPKEKRIVWLCDGSPDTRHQEKYAAGISRVYKHTDEMFQNLLRGS